MFTDNLVDMRVGWQKVATRYFLTIHVFERGGRYQAVTNMSQGLGTFLETIHPEGPSPAAAHIASHGRFTREAETKP